MRRDRKRHRIRGRGRNTIPSEPSPQSPSPQAHPDPKPDPSIPQPDPGPLEWVRVGLPPRAVSAVGRPDFPVVGPSTDLSVIGVIRSTGCYEPHVMEAIIDKLAVGGTFLDVGANIGVHAVLAAFRVGSEGNVLAVEASPLTYPVLIQNLASTGCAAAVGVNVAAWDTPATVAFSHLPHILGGSHVNPSAQEIGQVFTVPCDSLDNLVERAGLERVDLIKIDVEGSEIRVLQGAQKVLSRFRPAIIVEFNPLTLREYGSSTVLNLYNCVRDSGYGMTILMGDGATVPVTDFAQMERISLQWTLRLDVLCEHTG